MKPGVKTIKGLYAVIDTTYVSSGDLAKVASLIIEGGARLLQLRAKGIGAKAALEACRTLRPLAAEAGVLFIVNDRIDVAMICGADGVHIGQDDIPLHEARRLLGGSAIIGVSTHNVEEAVTAEGAGADYVSFGPIFPTRTKADADVTKGPGKLKDIRAAVNLPIVAIGGITEETAPLVIESGADSAAIISDILLSPDIRLKVASIISKMEKASF